MWLVIRKSDDAVIGTNSVDPTGYWNAELFSIKEWNGKEPQIHDPDEGIESYDPTIDNPDWLDFISTRVDFDALAAQANNEIDWLNENIPLVVGADLETLRTFLQRVMVEQREELKAWRYIFRKA
jgi:hypothetical protein